MKHNINFFLLTISFFVTYLALADTQDYDYKSFHLSMDPVTVSIVQEGATFTPKIDLNISNTSNGLKDSAIAMGMGYCIFLHLTDVVSDLKHSGADDNLVNKIMSSMSINEWMAIAFQESAFRKDNVAHSGFYQIDNSPFEIASNAGNTNVENYYLFLKKLNGGATFGPGEPKTDPKCITDDNPKGYVYERDKDGKIIYEEKWIWNPEKQISEKKLVPKNVPNMAVLCELTEKGFTWASVEKGYYDAVSYIVNKNSIKVNSDSYIPYKGFNLAEWIVKYSKDEKPTKAPYYSDGVIVYEKKYLYIPDKSAYISPTSSLGIVISYLYNRGQMPYANYALPQSKLYVDVLIHHLAFQESFEDFPSGQDAVAYGKRYIWQVPWLFTMLNRSKTIYTEKISLNDVLAVLDMMKGFYSGEEFKNDVVIQATIDEANKLKWDYPYNSPQFFDNIYKLTELMLDKSLKIK